MINNAIKIVCIFIFTVLLMQTSVYSCSIFSLKDGNTFFLAGNEDWYHSASSVKIVPATSQDFGYAIFGVSTYIDSHPQIGLNEKGLGVDWATIPQSDYLYLPKLENLRTPLIPELMKHCESVQDVIEFIRKYNIPHFANEHLLVADRFGNSIVLEWHKNSVQVISSDTTYQLITNFNILDPSTGWYPCDRFSAGNRILKAERGTLPSIEYINQILKAMHSKGEIQTLYSYIFDLQKKDIVLYNRSDFSKKTILHLEHLLKKGKHTLRINDLIFNNASKEGAFDRHRN